MIDFRNPASLADARTAIGVSKSDLARASGLSVDAIAKIEGGSNDWRLSTFLKLEKALEGLAAARAESLQRLSSGAA